MITPVFDCPEGRVRDVERAARYSWYALARIEMQR